MKKKHPLTLQDVFLFLFCVIVIAGSISLLFKLYPKSPTNEEQLESVEADKPTMGGLNGSVLIIQNKKYDMIRFYVTDERLSMDMTKHDGSGAFFVEVGDSGSVTLSFVKRDGTLGELDLEEIQSLVERNRK